MPGNNKRKFSEVEVPPSLTSYLWGVLSTDFSSLKRLISREYPHTFSGKPAKYISHVLEEMFPYLYLLAELTENGSIPVSPSAIVDKAFHCLLLDPVLYSRVCEAILTHLKLDNVARPVRVLPHDPFGGDDMNARKLRYEQTLVLYKNKFGDFAPVDIWSDYSQPQHNSRVITATPVVRMDQHPSPEMTIGVRRGFGDPSDDVLYIRGVKLDTTLQTIFDAYINRMKLQGQVRSFFFDGVKLKGSDTVRSYELQDDDIIDVVPEQRAC